MIRLTAATFFNERETKKKLVRFITEAKQLSFGKECVAFEKAFAKWQGRREAVFVNSGSSANLALMQALVNVGELTRGDRVAFSAVTWSTNVMPLLSLGLVPVPMDVSLETLNVESDEVARVIKNHKVKAVFITNLLGFCHDLSRIRSLCKNDRVLLIEDNCESLGSVEGGRKLGNFGLAATCSFFVGHHLSTIEGGMICTDDRGLATALRIVRAHGWDRQLDERVQKNLRRQNRVDRFYGSYTFYDIGYNLRPMEINGFIGKVTLPYLKKSIARREKLFDSFQKTILARPDAYVPLKRSHMDTLSAFALPVICKNESVRRKLIAACEGKVEVRPIVGGDMTSQPFFKKYVPSARKKYPTPNASRIHRLGLYLPLRPDLTAKEKQVIRSTLASA